MRRKDLSAVASLLVVLAVMAAMFPAQGMAAPANAGQSDDPPPLWDPAAQTQQPATGETPLQQSLRASIEERQAQDLPVPASVSYSYDVVVSPADPDASGAGSQVTVVGTTAIAFDHPEQAGYDRWPDVVVEEGLPPNATGTVLAGDYTQKVKDALEQELPGIWEQYEYGYEPRNYTFVETFELTYPSESPEAVARKLAGISDSSSVAQILMGFSYTGPQIKYILEEEWKECLFGLCTTVAKGKAGLELDWSLGIRLPVEVSLTLPDVMNHGNTYWLSSSLTPLDWSASDYTNAGLSAEGGNEYLLRFVFFVGFKVWILGVAVVDAAVDMDFDASQSFTTPLGQGAPFPLVSANLSPDVTGLQRTFYKVASLGIGLVLQPQVGSQQITANWRVLPGGDGSGSGSITYTSAGTKVDLGPVEAADLGPSDRADLELAGFRYWFDKFSVKISGYLRFELFGYGVKTGNFKITDFSLPAVTGGLWVDALESTPGSVVSSVKVEPGGYVVYLPLLWD